MSLRRLFSLHNSLQPHFEKRHSFTIIFSKSIQALAIITENPLNITTLNLTHNVEWSPGSISYSKLLSQCCQSKSLNAGLQIHSHLIKLALENDAKHRNHLINLYSKCGVFGSARKLLDESPEPDLVGWSALISGYAQNGLGDEAISGFIEMHRLGIRCNEFTFPSVLKACSMKKDIVGGKQIHKIVVMTGYESDVFVANTLVVVYAKCGEFVDSRRLFDEIPERNIVSWNALFSCYTQGDLFEEAIGLFLEMVGGGMRPDEFSLSTIINACTGLRDINQGRKIHGYLMKLGYGSDPFSCNALVDMYSKGGDFEDAKKVFERIPKPDIVSWNAVISGCVLHEYNDMALDLMLKMRRSGIAPNMFTYSSVLKACSGLVLQDLGQQLHSVLIKSDIELDAYLCCGLIDIYSKCGEMDDATKVYNLMPEKELIALNALLCGHTQNNNDIEALSIFSEKHKDGIGFNETTLLAILNAAASLQDINVSEQIHGLSLKTGYQSDPFVINSLVDSYAKCGYVEKATTVFDESPVGDIATFTSLISAYAQSGHGEEAIKLYLKMQDLELRPDSFICSSLLNTSASLSAYEQGKQIHVHTLKFGLLSEIFTANSLVNMYARCGSIDDANRAFAELPEKSIVSWSAMIGGLAQHGHGKEALSLFDDMLKDGVAPNNVTLVSVLCACNHAGLVTQAKRYFESMEDIYGIKPTQEHYACMVDILGRAGKLDEAMDLVNKMPFEANASVWGALLGAAKTHKNVDLGQRAFRELMLIQPEKSGTHVLLANIYASVGLWENVIDIRRFMKHGKVKKEPGMSWLEIKDKVYTFIVEDRSHSMTKEIYAKLNELLELVGEEGYVPDLDDDFHNVERSEKERLLSFHSEKLAVAFGLISMPPKAPIRVKKNLRICKDCHKFFKYVSKVVKREIIIRDIMRFHHFRDGSCSCGDYCNLYLEWLLAITFVGGIAATLNYRWSFEEALCAMEDVKTVMLVTDDDYNSNWHSNLKPSQLFKLLRNITTKDKQLELPMVKKILNGGGSLSAKLIEDATSIFPNARLFTAYGMTEGCPSLTFMTLHDPTKRIITDRKLSLVNQEGVCVGRPAPHVELKISTEGSSHVGQILTKGPHLMIGYWDQISVKENFGSEGWHETGDIGRIDDNGNLWLIGRLKGRIKSGGENIYPEEVETVILKHPGISAIAVVGLPDTRLAEMVVACIQLNHNWTWAGSSSDHLEIDNQRISSETLQQFCRTNNLTG